MATDTSASVRIFRPFSVKTWSVSMLEYVGLLRRGPTPAETAVSGKTGQGFFEGFFEGQGVLVSDVVTDGGEKVPLPDQYGKAANEEVSQNKFPLGLLLQQCYDIVVRGY